MLLRAAEEVRTAYALAGRARNGISDAVAMLDRLGTQNSQPLPPPQLRRAVDELDRAMGLLQAGETAVTDIAVRL